MVPNLKTSWENALWVLATIVTLLATPQPDKAVFLVLTGLNIAIFSLIYLRRKLSFALHLDLISIVALVAGLPEEWGRSVMTQFSRETFIAGAAVVYVLVYIALTRDPKLGILGGLIAGVSVGIGLQQSDAIHWAVQAGVVFLLLHSLRWIDSEEQGVGLARWLTALAWVAHSLVWTHFYGAGWRAFTIAVTVLAACFVFRWFRGKWIHPIILLASLLVLLAAPGHAAAIQIKSAPAGLLAMIGSFVLFGLGTLGALTKHRWSSARC
jgi:hypothetical protein